MTDGELTDTATVTMTIDGRNDAPIAGNDAVGTDEDTAVDLTAAVLANDSDPDTVDTVSITAINTAGTTGEVTLVGNVLTYDPNGQFDALAPGETATDSFTYTVTDGSGVSDTATVTVTIDGVNDAPNAADDPDVPGDPAYTVDEDGALSVPVAQGVLENDSDVDSAALTATKASDPANGQVVVNADGSFEYTPNADFFGTDSFTYTAGDGLTQSEPATVTITVTEVPPVVLVGDHQLVADTPGQTIQLFVSGGDAVQGMNLYVQIADGGPEAPGGSIDGPEITAVDTITGTIFDGNNTGMVDLDESGAADIFPQFEGIAITTAAGTVAADGLLATVTIDTTGFVEDTFALIISDTLNGPSDFATRSIAAVDGTIEVVPGFATVVDRHVFYNESSFDGKSAAANAADDEAVAPDKDPLLPVAGNKATLANYTSYSRGINGIMVDVANLPAGRALTADDFEFHVGNTDNPDTWAPGPAPTEITVRAGAGVTDPATEQPTDRVTLTWADNAIEKQWLQVTMKATAGLAADDVFYFGNAVGEGGDSALNTFVNATDQIDARNNPHFFFNPAPLDDLYDYNRDENVNATDQIIARNNPAFFFNALKLISVPVVEGQASIAEEPEATAIDVGHHYVLPNTPGQSIEIFVTGGDDVQGLNFYVQVGDGGPAVGGTPGPVIEAADIVTGTIFAANNVGETDFDGPGSPDALPQWEGLNTVTAAGTVAADGLLATVTIDTSSFSIGKWALLVGGTLNGDSDFAGLPVGDIINGWIEINNPPTANADAATADEDGPAAVIDVRANDTDPDPGDKEALTVIAVTPIPGPDGTKGTVTTDGTNVTYDPNGAFECLAVDETATDTFTYTVSDGKGGTDTATVTVTIEGQNDPPTANDDTGIAGEDGPAVILDVLANDTDPDDCGAEGDSLSIQSVDVAGTLGTVTNNGGNVSYDPDGAFDCLPVGETATDTFTYTMTDGNGGTDTATVVVTVIGQNDAPTALNDADVADEDGPAVAIDVLANDSDPDDCGNVADTLSVVSVTQGTAGGSVTVTHGGADVTYDPNGAFENLPEGATATDTFTYTISDGNGGASSATVTVTVNGQNDAPVAEDDTGTTDEDSVLIVPPGGDVTITTIDVGTHVLLPDTPGQKIPIYVVPSADAPGVAGVNFNVQVADGGPEAPGGVIDGPAITHVELIDDPTFGVCIFGTVPNQGHFGAGGIIPQFYVENTATLSGAVAPDGLLAVVTIDTTGFLPGEGPWPLMIDGTRNGETRLDDNTPAVNPIPLEMINGSIVLVAGAAPAEEIAGLLGNDTDVDDGDTKTVTAVNGDPGNVDVEITLPSGALLTVEADGGYQYDPNGQFENLAVGQTATDSFAYTVADGHDATDAATVTITITGENDDPTAVDDASVTDEDTPVSVDGVLDNDTDPDDGDVLSVTEVNGAAGDVGNQVTLASGALLTLNADGSYTYDPNKQFEALDEGETATDTFTYTVADNHGVSDTATVVITIEGRRDTEYVDAHVFYNDSAFDGNDAAANAADDDAVATDKVPLLPGDPAGFENYTSYSRGINGVMVDVFALPADVTLTPEDFEFRVGNDDDPAGWDPAPAPTEIAVRRGDGVLHEPAEAASDRISITWANNAIEKQWLLVIVKATANTGLQEDVAFFFGNAIGEGGNSPTDAFVNATDQIDARNNPHFFFNPAPIDDHYDYDRDTNVNATDQIIARNNPAFFFNSLKLLTMPNPASAGSASASASDEAPAAAAVDKLLETYWD